MTEVVSQCNRLGEVFVEGQVPSDRPSDLRNLKAVGKAGAEQVAFVIYKNLGFVFEAAESGRVNNAITVTLIFASSPRGRFSETPST
jgi:hypothetical protein